MSQSIAFTIPNIQPGPRRSLVIFSGNSTEYPDPQGLLLADTIGGGSFGGLIGIGGEGEDVGGKPGTEPLPSADSEFCSGVGDMSCIPLLAPLGKMGKIDVKAAEASKGVGGAFIDYFLDAANLLMQIATGFAVLWVLIGSYFIMVSGSDSGKRSTGKTIITWALIGLVIVSFTGFILTMLNDVFFIPPATP